MELLAAESMSPEECDSAFVVGVFSLLDVMLGVPLDRALELLSLPAPVADALARSSGPYANLLTLARACDTGDDQSYSLAARALGLSDRKINLAHLDALAWADQMAQ